MGCQRQLTVDDNTKIASGVRDGDSSAEHQDVMTVNLVQLTADFSPATAVASSPLHALSLAVICPCFLRRRAAGGGDPFI